MCFVTLVCVVDTSGLRRERERALTVNGDDDTHVGWCHKVVIFGLK